MKTLKKPTPVPQFKDLKFHSDAEFEKWLKGMKPTQIDFVDTGRDMFRIWIHESGEILHSNAQTWVWVGKFVDIDQLIVGMHVSMTLDNAWTQMKGLVIEQIKKPK